ncbi:MAG TPA: hypothetical protein ENN40_10745 [Candidatus Aminicenantes bacterium]|nr:hypothetical protein [Candidatus Aminicenantes bacterium]
MEEYLVECWNCAATYNAVDTVLCNHFEPTTVCPFCLKCFCGVKDDFRNRFWRECPQCLHERRKLLLSHRNSRLGEMLLRAGKITPDALSEAVEKQAFMRKPLGEILVMMDALTVEELSLFLADQKVVERIDLSSLKLDHHLVKRLGAAYCVVHHMIPIELYRFADGEILRFAVQSVDQIPAIKRSRVVRDFVLIPYLALPEEFKPFFQEIVALAHENKK